MRRIALLIIAVLVLKTSVVATAMAGTAQAVPTGNEDEITAETSATEQFDIEEADNNFEGEIGANTIEPPEPSGQDDVPALDSSGERAGSAALPASKALQEAFDDAEADDGNTALAAETEPTTSPSDDKTGGIVEEPTPPSDTSGQPDDVPKAPTTGENSKDPPNEGIIVDCVDPQTLKSVQCEDNGKDNSEDDRRAGQDEDPSTQKGINKQKAITEPDEGKKDANEKDDPATEISILCAPGYNHVEGSDPSGHEDKCVTAEDEDIVVDQAATISESVISARDHQILDEDGNVVDSCASGYYFLDNEFEFDPPPLSPVGEPPPLPSHPSDDPDRFGDNDCVPEFTSPCFNPEPGVITTQEESVNDRSVGDGFTALGKCAGDLVRIVGFVPWYFDEWSGEFLSWLGDKMGIWGWGLAWPMMATAEVSDFVSDALSWWTWSVAEVIDDVSNEVGDAIDEAVDTVEDAAEEVWDSFTSCFGFC